MDIGPWELIIVLGLAVLLFGSNKIPQLARSIGSAKSEYERGLRGETDDEESPAEPVSDPLAPATAPSAELTADASTSAVGPEHLVEPGPVDHPTYGSLPD